MAVRTLYGLGTKDPTTFGLPNLANAQGRPRIISSGNFPILSDDSINTKLFFGKIPSHAVPIKGLSTVLHSALTDLSDFDIGLYKDGTLVDIDVFADGLTLASAGAKDPFASIAAADIGKPVWRLIAGLTVDPACEYDVVGTVKAAPSTTGTIAAQLFYAMK